MVNLVVKTLVCFHEVLGLILMDACINISCTNVIYRYVHQGEWCENLFVDKIGKRKT